MRLWRTLRHEALSAVDAVRQNPDPTHEAEVRSERMVAAGIGLLVLAGAVGTYLAVAVGLAPAQAHPITPVGSTGPAATSPAATRAAARVNPTTAPPTTSPAGHYPAKPAATVRSKPSPKPTPAPTPTATPTPTPDPEPTPTPTPTAP